MKGQTPDFRALLAAILPYAESRAEDMDNDHQDAEASGLDATQLALSRMHVDAAIAAVDAAKAALAEAESGAVCP